MKNKKIFTIAIISLIICIGIAAYLWYLYFHDYEIRLMNENCKTDFANSVKIINTGKINYVNASVEDSDSIVPVYYFSIKNSSKEDFNYEIFIEDSEGNDGCDESSRLKWDQLEYELRLDNKVIKKAGLDSLINGALDTNIIKAESVNDYSIKVRLKNDDIDFNDKHFHYIINMREKK